MKRILLLLPFSILFFIGCVGQEPIPEDITWTFMVIDDSVREYSLQDLSSYDSTTIVETLIEKEITKISWNGPLARLFGEGDIINFISEDGYVVSIPYEVDVILAYQKEGVPVGEEDGGPLKIIVDPYYGCKCNWLKFLKIVEFVDKEESFSVYGEVFNLITFSYRDLNLYYGLENVIDDTNSQVPLLFILDKALCKENATTITFVTESGRFTYSLEEIRDIDPLLTYDDGFFIEGLGIEYLQGIKIE
ncbi:MAG: molybdopterin-dependent oxidoreductase [Theionarchaea archaeon]|nr:molybdopterin-dependent oxidoreductase [Theionarchaea archaeon]